MSEFTISIKPGECRCGCGKQLLDSKKRQFRQGHDARLKGVLIRAAVAGQPVVVNGNQRPARAFAFEVGVSFKAAVDKALARKASKPAPKPRPKATPSPKDADVGQVKVGRWFYDAKRLGDTVIYTTRSGEQVSANGQVAASFVPA